MIKLESMKKRYKNLDYLRGMLAFLIMLYHYNYWLKYPLTNIDFLNRISFYGVSIFFILSGFALYVSYRTYNFWNLTEIARFFLKRIARIFPLLIIAILFSLIYLEHYEQLPSLYKIFINITGVFALIDHSNYIATGSWSVGVELVLYLLFPLLLVLRTWSRLLTVFIVSFMMILYFTFLIDIEWSNYINPSNHLFYFLSGVLIGKYILEFTYIHNMVWLLAIVGVVFFILLPPSEIYFNEVVGWNRLILSYGSISIVFFAVLLPQPSSLNKIFGFLGEKSYAVYLLSPIVFHICRIYLFDLNKSPFIFMFLCIIITLICAQISWSFLEKPALLLSKTIDARIKKVNDIS